VGFRRATRPCAANTHLFRLLAGDSFGVDNKGGEEEKKIGEALAIRSRGVNKIKEELARRGLGVDKD
jgi:hypothetical protein